MKLHLSRVFLALVASFLFGQLALAADDRPEILLSIKDHKFLPVELTVPAGQKVVIMVDNQDATPEEFESHELNREKVIPASSKGKIFIGPLDAGSYPFFGDFHQDTAQGKIIARLNPVNLFLTELSMLATAIIVFREMLEAALIVGIVAAATRGVARRNAWIIGGITAGLLGAITVAPASEHHQQPSRRDGAPLQQDHQAIAGSRHRTIAGPQLRRIAWSPSPWIRRPSALP